MPVDNITATLNEVARIGAAVADALGAGFEIDRPYDLDDEDFPLVIMRTGPKEVVEDDGMPNEAWDAIWELSPAIQIFLSAETPTAAAAAAIAASQLLRQEINQGNLLEFIQDGTKPKFREDEIEVEDRPGCTGLHGQFGLIIYND